MFAYLPGPTQARLAASFAEGELQELFDGLQPDDAADLLEELPADLVDRILRAASPQRADGREPPCSATRRTAPAAS